MQITYHVEHYCPGIEPFYKSASAEDKARFPKGYRDYNNPDNQYQRPLIENIRSLHYDLYITYRWAKNTKDARVLHGMFGCFRSGCLEGQVRSLQEYHVKTSKGLSYAQVVEAVLNDYARHVCLSKGWDVLDHAALALKDDGVHYYIEDIVDFAKKYHAGMTSREGKTINDFENYLEEILAYDRRPAALRAGM